MLFPQDLEQRLGFDVIRARLEGYCVGDPGKACVHAMHFQQQLDKLLPLLRQNLELRQWLERGDPFPLTSYIDPQPWWATISVEGAFLEVEDIFQLLQSLRTLRDLMLAIDKRKLEYPALFQLIETLQVPNKLLQTLSSYFDDQGKLADNATPELARVRKRLREEESQMRRLTDRLFRQAADAGWVPEGISATVRDGRLVIPILAEHKRKLKGLVVDESSTGQTVFMEPVEVLEANNEIRDLQLAERREIIRILRELTDLLRSNLHHLQQGYTFLAVADFTYAKARLSLELEADLPELQQEPILRWQEARHPLLVLNLKGKRPMVPLNLTLDGADHFLLVSGPNAGGKSVCLKTVGLIQYMLQCGLLVPLDSRSRMGLFSNLMVDIGDQQSIENDLSTYSSHLRNMKLFTASADDQSMVLLDELGGGTDPNFGGGIAQAVLADLISKKCWGVATTHYHNLKVFASNTPGILNGAMLFDTTKLQPLYVLEVGKPGSSFALEIAQKIGFPERLLQDAEEIIGKDVAGLEKLIKKVAEDQQEIQRKTRTVAQREKELAALQERYQKLADELEARKKEILERARSEASLLLKETNREIEKTIRHIKENKAEKKETKKVRESLKELSTKVATPQAKLEVVELKVGDKVRIRGQEVTGTLLEINGKQTVIRFGEIRTVAKLDQLVRSDQVQEDPVVKKARSLGLDLYARQATFNTTLDVRGKRVEEVLPILTQFIDDALLLAHGELRILHGKGEGVLRQVIREALKRNKHVASAADEHVERGGAGITVVVLK
jgi:DNA mismatch repair protein MutS2